MHHADPAHIGKRLRCRRCGRETEIRAEDAITDGPRIRRRRRRGSLVSRVRGWFAGVSHAGPVAPSRRQSRPARTTLALSWGYLAAVVAIAALMWTLGDRWWPATTLLFMGRWVFLLPLAILAPAALVLSRRALVPLVLGALAALGPVMGFRTGWRAMLSPAEGDAFRVVTFNVGGDGGAGATVAYLLPTLLVDWAPDVVAFQECGQALGRAVRAVEGWHRYVGAGSCVVSRHPIRESAVMDRTALAQVRRSSGAGGAGFVVRHTLETPAGAVDVTTLHLETPRKGFEGLPEGDLQLLRANTDIRDIESRLARRWVEEGRHPRIVAGDFNTPVESRIFREHWGDLANAFSRAGRGFGYTKHNGWIRIRIDHVLAGPEWEVRSAWVGRGVGSDHRPVVADLVPSRR